jgi:two-component system phosphate regulon sensor histidine kinase PhoR
VSNIWKRFIYIVLITLFFSAIFWGIFGAAFALLLFGVTLFWIALHHVSHLVALERWLLLPKQVSANIPAGSGEWDDVFAYLARYVRQHSQSQELLSLALERMRNVTAAMPDGIVLLTENDRIEWCNPVAEDHLGISLALDSGQQITHLVRQVPFVEYLSVRNFTKPLILNQTRRRHKSVFSLQFVPYGFNQKLLISRDITRFEKLETMRQDFIANVSHELRTPLTVISGFLDTLTHEETTPDFDKRALALMSEQAIRMQSLVEDLLVLSRLENEQNKINETIINVADLLSEILRGVESLSTEKHLIKLDIATQSQLLGSETELRSAFSNLINNAVRYTPEGGEISIHWQEKDGQGIFYVQDSGIGIEAQHIPRLTERFYRIDTSRSRETGGTGLGLAIVKHVVNRHDARLQITSEIGKGSRFTIVFPAKRLVV